MVFENHPVSKWLSHTILEIEDISYSIVWTYSSQRPLLENCMVCENHLVPNGCPIPLPRSKIVSPHHIVNIEFPENIVGGFYGLWKPPSVEWLSHTIPEIQESFPIPYCGHKVPGDHYFNILWFMRTTECRMVVPHHSQDWRWCPHTLLWT